MSTLQNLPRLLLSDPGFRIHLIVYFAVNTLLLVINMISSPENVWFFWPLLGWGLGLIGHGFAVYQTARTIS